MNKQSCRAWLWSFLLVPCLLAGCQTVMELELPAPEHLLVVNGVLNPDSLVRIEVSSSQSTYTSGTYPPVEDALVQLYQNGRYIYDVPHIGQGVYRATEKPQPLQTYELRVSAPSYPSVSASTQVLSAPTVTNVRSQVAPPRAGSILRTLDVAFTLTDTLTEDNYYYLQAYTVATSPLEDKRQYNRSIAFDILAPIEADFSLTDRFFFNDKYFNGQKLNLQLNLDHPPTQRLFIRVAHIPRTHYDYVRLLDKQSLNDNIFGISTPVTNNIRGGLGLFTSATIRLL